jgi:hypothetical protein
MTTMSAAAIDFWFKRKDSLTSRLTRFLDTALPDDLVEMARPNRGLLPGRDLARTVNRPSVDRTGFSNTLSKSPFDRRRSSAPKGPLTAVMTSPSLQWTHQGVSRALPLARRRARIWRPFFVAIRARNPWLRLRRRLLGWKVRFIVPLSGACMGAAGERSRPRQKAGNRKDGALLCQVSRYPIGPFCACG